MILDYLDMPNWDQDVVYFFIFNKDYAKGKLQI